MKKLLITGAFGKEAQEMAKYSVPSFHRYARTHNYDFAMVDNYNNQVPSWQKVYAFQDYLKTYDVVFWLDIDAMIVNFDNDLSTVFEHTAGFQALAVEPIEPNAGVWLMKKSGRSMYFLDELIKLSPKFQTGCWEQDAIKYLLGYISAGQKYTYFERFTILLQEKWNNIHGNISPEETIVQHFAGRSGREKITGLKELAGNNVYEYLEIV